jgi:RNA polymerase sigma factor for flagellar operon FliA
VNPPGSEPRLPPTEDATTDAGARARPEPRRGPTAERPGAPPRADEPEALARFHAELDLVDINARQVARQIGSSSVTLDDLRSFGREGLLQASRSFDASRGVPFRRWANMRIRGAMIDGVRQWGALPRRVYRELRAIAAADRVQEAHDEESAGGPAPSPQAADARLTSHLAGLATAMALGGATSPTDGREPADDDASPEEQAMRTELVARVREVVARLPVAERTLVERHYFGDETLDQAAASLGLSKSWGSRLHARAIDAIAKEMGKKA